MLRGTHTHLKFGVVWILHPEVSTAYLAVVRRNRHDDVS